MGRQWRGFASSKIDKTIAGRWSGAGLIGLQQCGLTTSEALLRDNVS